MIDGRLDDASWKNALSVPSQKDDLPTLLLGRNSQSFYVAASLPASAAKSFLGPATARDAGGAVDGVKNGRYAFHTGHEPDPWWQVDLGTCRSIGTIVV